MKKLLLNLLFIILPFVDNCTKNKKIKKKINKFKNGEKEVEVMYGCEKLSQDMLMQFLNRYLEQKRILEEKAKINIIGVTIAVTLIFGLSQLIIENIFNNDIPIVFYIGFVTIGVISILYMIIAGITSIATLHKDNVIYDIYPFDLLNDEKTIKCNYILNIELNINQNIIRNNNIYTSYECIRNSLVCLLIFFILIFCLPFLG